MGNDYFRFRQFTIRQACCAMKVGTDGTLLGAWAHGGKHILDIGTGTGLIALMMAQRFPEAIITAIDIDEGAVEQARENVQTSPFADRIRVVQADVKDFESGMESRDTIERYDAVVCNPPYFEKALQSPDSQRTMARHTTSLPYATLMACAQRLLADNGELSVVIPFDFKNRLENEALLSGFFKCRECGVRTTPAKPVRRYLLSFIRHQCELERTEGVIGSEWYNELTQYFYL